MTKIHNGNVCVLAQDIKDTVAVRENFQDVVGDPEGRRFTLPVGACRYG
jgi:hypothetical protein